LLDRCAVVLVAIDQHRRERLVSGEVPNLVKTDTRLLALLNRRRNRRVAQAVTPDVQPHPLPELADDPQDRSCLERATTVLAPLAARLEQRTGHRAAVTQIPPDRRHDGGRQRGEFLFLPALPLDPRRATGE